MSKFNIKMSKKTENNLITISNDIAESRYMLSMPTQKFLWFLISEITLEEKESGNFIKEHQYDLDFLFEEVFSYSIKDKRNAKRQLMQTIQEIKDNAIDLRRIDENGNEVFISYPWYAMLKFDESQNYFKFKFNQEISSLLLKLKENGIGYYKSYFKEYVYLKSSYSSKLYEILRAETYLNKARKYGLNDLKTKLKVNKRSVNQV